MKNYLSKLWLPVAIVLIAAAIRLLPHPPNFTPIGAMALFGGAYLSKRYTFLLPVLVMFVSDLILGFHLTMPWVYGSFLLIALLGVWLKKQISAKNILLASCVSSLLFFFITNFGVWLVTDMYPKTIEGLVLCYTLAVPFFRNTLMGDLVYSGLFFAGYLVISSYLTSKAKAGIIRE